MLNKKPELFVISAPSGAGKSTLIRELLNQHEDFDLSIRIGQLGKLIYAPEVRITHSGGNTSSKGFWHIRRFLISGIKFFNTHGWSFF